MSPNLDATLVALADPSRRGVVELLRAQPRRASELADELGLSRPAMSRHLRVMRDGGLIEPEGDETDARARIYKLRPEPFAVLRDWIADVERFWTLELAAFKQYAEATRGKRER